MKINHKSVLIYSDKNLNLICIPTGKSKNFGGAIMGLDIVHELKYPYSNDELENTLMISMNECYSQVPINTTEKSSLERYLNINGFSKAVKNKKLIAFEWDCDDYYYIVPTAKIPKRGYVDMEDKKIILGIEIKKGKLAEGIKEAICLSITY